MSIDLGRLLIASGAVPQVEVEAALFLAVLRGISFPRALLDRAAITERALEDELDRRGGLAMRQVVGSRDLFARLPRAICRRLAAVPTRIDPVTSTVDVASADPLDPHVPAELGFHFGLPVRVLRAPIAAVEEAIRVLELDDRAPAAARARARRVTPAFPHGAPQSTIPPPPVEDVPIPLVRRAASQSAPPTHPGPPGHPRAAPPDGPAAPGGVAPSPVAAPGRFDPRNGAPSTGPISPVIGASPVAGPPALDMTGADGEPVLPLRHTKPESATRAARADRPPSQGRPPALRQPAVEPPAISFPSSPPPALPSPLAGPLYFTAPADPAVSDLVPAPPAGEALPAWAQAPAARGIAAAFAAGIPPESATPTSDPTPPTMRQGRIHLDEGRHPAFPAPALGRPAVSIHIPGPREAREPQPEVTPAYDIEGPEPPRDEAEPAHEEPEDVLEDGPPPLPFADPTDILDAVYRARSRDEVVRLTLRGLRLIARRIAVFAVKRGAFRGLACNVQFGDEEALRGLSIAVDQPSILATATATSVYLGPIPGTSTHAPLLDIMENPSLDVAAVAVRVGGRPVMILVADQLGDTLTGTRRVDELARAAGEALTRILAARG